MFKATLQGLPGLKAQFASLSADLEKIVGGELESMAKEWVLLAKQDSPADQTALRSAISYYKNGELSYDIVSQTFYAPFMEFGTKGKYLAIPGTEKIAAESKAKSKKGGGKGFYDNILEWVKRKGFAALTTKGGAKSKSLDSTIAQEQAAFAIYLSIMRHGVKPHPYFFKQMGVVWPKMLQSIVRRLNNVNAKLTTSGRPQIENV